MQKAILVKYHRKIRGIGNFDLVYYGSQFCQNLIPTLDNMETIFDITKKREKEFTLLTPYVTACGMEKLKPLFQYLNSQKRKAEVVFNDWGVFKFIKENYKNITPVLGRLLTKQRKDPRGYNILLNKQKTVSLFGKKNKKEIIVVPKKIPLSLYEHFKGSVINLPIFQDFLLKNGITRVEIDNLVWDMKIELKKRLRATVYLPYAYVSTTRLCGLINLTYSSCQKTCRDYYFSFRNSSSPVPFYMRGNTVFYKTKMPKESYLENLGVDRIVYEPEIPI